MNAVLFLSKNPENISADLWGLALQTNDGRFGCRVVSRRDIADKPVKRDKNIALTLPGNRFGILASTKKLDFLGQIT